MTSMPAPEILTVKLVPDIRDAAGRPLRVAPTCHDYSHTEERRAHVLADNGEPMIVGGLAVIDTAFVHIYRCAVTGATRAYGCEGPNSPHITDDNIEEEN